MTYLNDFISLLYPKLCAACEDVLLRNENVICTSCLFHLPKTNYHKYADNPVSKTFWGRIPIESAASLYYFTKLGAVQNMIHQFKYKGDKKIGVYLGKMYGLELKKSDLFSKIDVIIPVPLHPKKEKKRGFNQSLIFAQGLSDSMQKPIDSISLIRTYASETQTKKTRFKRWENVKEIFSLQNAEHLAGKNILLVDDVITTGATIEACGGLLLGIKGVKLYIVSIAVASS